MIVLAILAVVAAVSYPVWMSSKKGALERQTDSNLYQVWVALELYRNDNDATGSNVGTGDRLGLPPRMVFYNLVFHPMKLQWPKLNPEFHGGIPYYPMQPADKDDLDPNFFDELMSSWETHNKRYEGRSVLLASFFHTEDCNGWMNLSPCTLYGIGIQLDGSRKRKRSSAKSSLATFWNNSNED
jgi:type II secretory pathway pseudopilin PulG